jgi:hypothetical protein
MKGVLATLGVVAMLALLVCASLVQAQEPPAVDIWLVEPPPAGLLELPVGQSHTFEVHITSNEPFVLAMALTDQYYPGRSIYVRGGDRASQGTEAVLYITMTGKHSTAELPAVCDWPEPGDRWPEGVAPVSIAAGVRYKGGVVVAEQFPFAVVVP